MYAISNFIAQKDGLKNVYLTVQDYLYGKAVGATVVRNLTRSFLILNLSAKKFTQLEKWKTLRHLRLKFLPEARKLSVQETGMQTW